MSQSMMSYRQHARAMLLLGFPLIGSHLAQAAVGLTDTVMLGWYDVEALAAGVLATSFFFMLFVLASGFSFAVMPLVASASSAGDPVQVRRVTRMGLWLSIAFAILLYPLMWWSGRILLLLGQEPVIAELAQTYFTDCGVRAAAGAAGHGAQELRGRARNAPVSCCGSPSLVPLATRLPTGC